MFCPACRHKDTKVSDSRVGADGTTIRRRRECLKCHFRFSTLEEVEILDLTVVKRDGRREAYRREKITAGLHKAFEKRPITEEDFMKLVHAIERDIQARRVSEIRSSDIGEILMEHLQAADSVAYIRFASVYRKFEDAERFQQELQRLFKKQRRVKRPHRA
ncbi:transcriptional repressor NrdR [Candidatus Uhrbacteria bacterium]|nr:transcriptional repressor NrdR [Candidatus Uhrbacteria bacterium]